MDTRERLMVCKALSGRLWLTMITGAVFWHLAVSGQADPEHVLTVVSVVFMSYFNKQRDPNEPRSGQADQKKGDDNAV